MVEYQWQNQSKKLVDVSHLQIQIIEKVSWKIESQESIKNSLISHWFQDQEEN